MSTPPSSRAVRISDDERGGWSSDRPRRDGAPPRPRDISTRCRVLRPTDRIRYSPGSLLLIVSTVEDAREEFADRVIESKGSLLSLPRLRKLLAGRVPDEELDARAAELLDATVQKRLTGDGTVVVTLGLDAEERQRYVRVAAEARRPRHVMLLEPGRELVSDEDLPALNDLRRRLDAAELGEEGIQTAMRLSAAAIAEVKGIVFRPAARDE